jgi:hypothetical protein
MYIFSEHKQFTSHNNNVCQILCCSVLCNGPIPNPHNLVIGLVVLLLNRTEGLIHKG